jgi:hypothetical protein
VYILGQYKNIVDLRLMCLEPVGPAELRRQRRRERWAYILGLFAVVFLWRAIWDWSDYYFTTTGSFIIGLALVAIVAWLNKAHVKDLF